MSLTNPCAQMLPSALPVFALLGFGLLETLAVLLPGMLVPRRRVRGMLQPRRLFTALSVDRCTRWFGICSTRPCTACRQSS